MPPRRQVTLDRIALSNMERLSATEKEIMVQAILDIANATADQILSRSPSPIPIRTRTIYMDANRSQFVDVRFIYMRNKIKIVGVFIKTRFVKINGILNKLLLSVVCYI